MPRPRSEHAIVFSSWPSELLHMFGVSAKLRAMVGLQSADSIWKALIMSLLFPFLLPKFAWYSHDGWVMDQVGIGVVALSKTIITPVTQPCAMLMPMVDLFFAIQIHECVCFIGASS